MPRQTLTKITPLGSYPTLPISANAANLTFVAANTTDKEQFAAGGNDLVLVWNSGASPYTVTVNSVADAQNRTGDIATYSIPAGTIAALGPFKQPGWVQTDGKVYMEASNVAIKYAVIALP